MSNDMEKSLTLKTLGEYLLETEQMLNNRGENPELSVTSIPSLNSKIWGFRKKEVTIIGARTSNGKSAFVNQLAWDFAKQGKKVLFLSIEMPVDRVIERLFCYVYRIDNYELLTGKFSKTPEYQKRWAQFSMKISQMKIIFCDYIGKTWQQVDETIEKLHSKPDVIFIDHIHHIKSNNGRMTEKQNIDDYLEHIRELVIRGNFVGILNAQINRVSQEDKEGEPQLHHLKATGKLEEIADNALLLWWPHHGNKSKPKNLFKINIAKNRYGATSILDLDFKPQFYAFSDYVAPLPSDKENIERNKYED